ncbi:PREDICTED: POC1 centriolar protein homolog B-like isoform X1 [Diuraphis noxia]|uniref:POC1 centriolar protein homolog B-like isoform X1 n=1 Tax=Diuraphis noxia TaxID=143948 RepID=UPI000763AFDA|nr:PREDICTED: POC1 centriolar protein homolog B-like isoform X1 [Diuraphis noxia]
MATGIECLKWNTSTFQPSNVLDHTEYTLALKPSHWLNLKSKGLSIKLSYLGLTQRLASLDNLNNLYVYDWSKANLKTLKSKYEHNSKLTSLTSNTLGNKIVTCSDNGKIQIWNYKFSSWKMLTEFRGHYQCVRDVQYSIDNKYLISCSNDKTFKIWDCHSNKFVASNMFHRNWVNTAKFFKEDKLIISCSRDCYVQVFDCCSGKCVAKFNLSPDFAESLSLKEEFSIAVGTNQGSIQIFDLRALKVLQKYNEHTSQVNCVKFQYKTPCLVSVSKDKKLNVYDTNEGRFLYSIDHLSEIRSMDISFDDKLLATTSFHFDNEITLWKTETL